MSRPYLERRWPLHLLTEGVPAAAILGLCLLALAVRGCA